jgi:formylglycine-generating enzyme required for sulfatase activity
MAQVFISYSRKDLPFVEHLAADLKEAGLDVWYDVSRLGGGSRWRIEIENALKKSQYVIVVLSPDSVTSEWVEREILFASNLKRKIIPLMYRQCDLPLNYVNLNYIDVRGENYAQNFNALLMALDLDATSSILPSPLPKKSSPDKSRTGYAALIGVGVLIVFALIFSLFIKAIFTPEPSPTVSMETTQAPLPSIPASMTLETNPPPSETLQSTVPSSSTEIPGVEGMVLVPEGIFTMGDNTRDIMEGPAHSVHLDAYYIDRYEVTNKQFMDCVDEGECDWPANISSKTRPSYYGNPEFDDFPVIYVSWDMARAFCTWRGARLPTEAEWEKAARGSDSRAYPWGRADVDCSRANYSVCGGDTVEVGSYESGKSPYEAYDMAGNVWEWVADWYQENYYATLGSNPSNPPGPAAGSERVIRGGSWINTPKSISTTIRNSSDPSKIYNFVGFRCAMDANP